MMNGFLALSAVQVLPRSFPFNELSEICQSIGTIFVDVSAAMAFRFLNASEFCFVSNKVNARYASFSVVINFPVSVTC